MFLAFVSPFDSFISRFVRSELHEIKQGITKSGQQGNELYLEGHLEGHSFGHDRMTADP